MRFYHLIFYVTYRFFIRLGRKSDPHGKAAIVVSIWNMLYFVVVISFIKEIGGYIPHFSRSTLLMIYLTVCISNLVFFTTNRKHLKIYREFRLEREYQDASDTAVFCVYISAPLILFILIAMVL